MLRLKDHEGSNPSSATINPWNGYLVNGPYLHENGRRFVILTCGKHIRKTTSYARYLMEKSLGRILTNTEEVDHINEDFTDDRLENLQVISKLENIERSKKDVCSKGHSKVNNVTRQGHCKTCNNENHRKYRRK